MKVLYIDFYTANVIRNRVKKKKKTSNIGADEVLNFECKNNENDSVKIVLDIASRHKLMMMVVCWQERLLFVASSFVIDNNIIEDKNSFRNRKKTHTIILIIMSMFNAERRALRDEWWRGSETRTWFRNAVCSWILVGCTSYSAPKRCIFVKIHISMENPNFSNLCHHTAKYADNTAENKNFMSGWRSRPKKKLRNKWTVNGCSVFNTVQ